jgi:hypothetical protein
MYPTTIVFGDIHGLTTWKTIAEDFPNSRYIFMGNYLDPYNEISPQELIKNLELIIQLKISRPDHVVLLLGDHDLHYISRKITRRPRFNTRIAKQAAALFSQHKHLFQFAYQKQKLLFTHAGIDHDWFVNNFKGRLDKNIAEQLNNPTKKQKPLLYNNELHGSSITDNIFWFKALCDPLKGFTQIVGHHKVNDITELHCDNGKYVLCNCLFNGKCFGIDDEFSDFSDFEEEDGDLSDVQKHTKPAVKFILAKWNKRGNIKIVWWATGAPSANVFRVTSDLKKNNVKGTSN